MNIRNIWLSVSWNIVAITSTKYDVETARNSYKWLHCKINVQSDKKLHCIYSGGNYLRLWNDCKNHMKKVHFEKVNFWNMKSRRNDQILNERLLDECNRF